MNINWASLNKSIKAEVNGKLFPVENGFEDLIYAITGSHSFAASMHILFAIWLRGAVLPTMIYALAFLLVK